MKLSDLKKRIDEYIECYGDDEIFYDDDEIGLIEADVEFDHPAEDKVRIVVY